jgi:hypothetical protein
LGRWLAAQPSSDVFPLCNLGSSTRLFRTYEQPWIERFVFGPARVRGEVIHVDRKHAEGVDLVGDVTDAAFHARLAGRQFRTVVCSNLLEHVDDIPATCDLVWSLVREGGYLVITGPYRYPIHLDPIDNGLRANPEQLATMFPGSRRVAGEIVDDHTFARYMFRSPWHVLEEIVRVFTPFRRPRHWVAGMRRWGWFHRRFAASALVLAKPGP